VIQSCSVLKHLDDLFLVKRFERLGREESRRQLLGHGEGRLRQERDRQLRSQPTARVEEIQAVHQERHHGCHRRSKSR